MGNQMHGKHATHPSVGSVDAYPGYLPLELAGPLVGHRRRRVVPPHVQHIPQIMQLGTEPDAAVGMQRADLVEVPAELTEAADVGGVEELDGDAEAVRHLVLDEVEHVLLVLAEEAVAAGLPVAVELDGLVAGAHEEEAAVGEVAEAVGVAHEDVAGDGDVRAHGDVLERVTEPHHVHVREEEVVSELEDGLLELVAAPHHLEVVLAHEELLAAHEFRLAASRTRATGPLLRSSMCKR